MTQYYPKYYYQDSVGMASSDIRPVMQNRLIDFSVRNLNFGTGDIATMLAIPAFTTVLMVNYLTVVTVAGSTGTFSVGDGTNTYIATAVAVAAGSYGAVPAPSNTNIHVWYAADSAILVTSVATANLTSGQINVFALMIYPQPYTYKDVDGNAHVTTFVDRNNWTSTLPVIP